jgi:hypothetical protein
MWGTLEGNPFLEGYDGDMYVSNTGSVVLHRAKVEDSSFDWYSLIRKQPLLRWIIIK